MYSETGNTRSLVVESETDREIWMQSWSPIRNITPIDSNKSLTGNACDIRVVGDAVLSNLNVTPHAFQRTERHVAETGDYISVFVCEGGWTVREFESGPVFSRPQHLHITDFAHPCRGLRFQGKIRGLLLPRCAIGLSPSKAEPAFSISAHTPIGRILYPAFAELFQVGDGADDATFAKMVQTFAALLRDLLVLNLEEESAGPVLRRAQFLAIRRHIETHLSDVEFQPDRIYSYFGVSRSTLYRMFLPFGGVRRYIQDRRMQRAVIDLATHPYHRGAIREAADRWGFSSESNFGRAVRDTFGVSPSEFANLKDRLEPTSPVPLLLGAWEPLNCPTSV